MSEPTVTYPLRQVLDEIKTDMKQIRHDVHRLETSSAVAQAVGRARAALWTAGIAAVTAGSALAVVVFRH